MKVNLAEEARIIYECQPTAYNARALSIASQLDKLSNNMNSLQDALQKYSCACEKPCALYAEEQKREAEMPHMMCGWWAKSVLVPWK